MPAEVFKRVSEEIEGSLTFILPPLGRGWGEGDDIFQSPVKNS